MKVKEKCRLLAKGKLAKIKEKSLQNPFILMNDAFFEGFWAIKKRRFSCVAFGRGLFALLEAQNGGPDQARLLAAAAEFQMAVRRRPAEIGEEYLA